MLDLQTEVTKLNNLYRSTKRDTVSTLLCGEVGSGKTYTICRTARKPVYMYSFDPGGISRFSKEIDEGNLVPDTRWETLAEPFETFAIDIETKKKEGFFSSFGTVAIDSFTNLVERIARAVARIKSRGVGELVESDYRVLIVKIIDIANLLVTLPCDTILSAHIIEKEYKDGKTRKELYCLGRAGKVAMPNLFDEVYIQMSRKKKDSKTGEIERVLQTFNDGELEARTRMGDGVFLPYEVPDFRVLRRKAGRAFEDKPSLKVKQ